MSDADLPRDWRTCAADLFEHREEVLHRLARQNPSVDSDELHDAFVKTILQIAEKPEKFDRSRPTTLKEFLVGASQLTLLGILRTARRRKAREEKIARPVVEDGPAARCPVDELADTEIAEWARGVAKTDDERNVLCLWELGHSDAEIAKRLGITPENAQLIRDRLTQRLRRLRGSFSDEP